MKRRKRKRIAGKFNSWLKITKQDTQVEGKSFSKDPLLREYIPFLIVYTKMTRRGRFFTASNKVACDKYMESLRI